MVKAFIKRVVPRDKEKEIIQLFREMRELAMKQPGYISGETMKNVNQPEEYLVISTWTSSADWQQWLDSPERQKIQKEIDSVLGGRTEYSLYHYGFSE
jgi:heme-degrading monooxygenase HmoA